MKTTQITREMESILNIDSVEVANHWSDCYEGRSKMAIIVSDRAAFDAIEASGYDGTYEEVRRRDGASHSEPQGSYSSLHEYQEALKSHFSGDKFFYKSAETEKEYIASLIKEEAEEGIDADFDKIIALAKSLDEIESGYYDCNGNLEMSDEDLNNPDRTGYRYDVYSYNLVFIPTEIEEEESDENE